MWITGPVQPDESFVSLGHGRQAHLPFLREVRWVWETDFDELGWSRRRVFRHPATNLDCSPRDQAPERFYFALGTEYTLLPAGPARALDDWN